MVTTHASHRISQQKARSILQTLKGRNVPEATELDYFTVGDHFRQVMLNLELEMLGLLSSPRAIERRIIGGFGTGKTHVLSYIDWMLQCNSPADSVISRIDLSKLERPSDLELLIVREMRPVEGGNYVQLLREAYFRIQNRYMAEYRGVTQKDIEYFFGTVLFGMLGAATGGVISPGLLNLLNTSSPIERFKQFWAGNTIQEIFNRDRIRVGDVYGRFVDDYLQLIRNPNAPPGVFETTARELSAQSKLADLILRVLAFAGIKMVVVLADELESLKRFDEPTMQQSLVAIRVFRDSFDSANRGEYPSIAFICASTLEFAGEQLRKSEPALHSRWDFRDDVIDLRPLTEADLDALIFRLRDLFYLAGKDLRAVDGSPSGDHEVIMMRKEIMEEYAAASETLTSRTLIPRVIKAIENTWLK